MKILIGCEESQAVCIAFRKLGHEAFSCDTEPCSGGHPEWHLQMDVFEAINLHKWDMGIFFPPCTHLACSGAKHFAAKIADGRQKDALVFVKRLMMADIEKICIENPVGVISSNIKKPDQIIQPYQFGDPFQKTTCLWLKNLPMLKHTNLVGKGEFVITPSGKKLPKWYSDNKSAKNRSKTFQGIADAMVDQWGGNNYKNNTKPNQSNFIEL